MEALRAVSSEQIAGAAELRARLSTRCFPFDTAAPPVNNGPMPDLRQLAPPPTRATPSRGSARRRLSPLARDIIVVLLVKAIVLYALWFAFFRMPAAPAMRMDTLAVEQRLVAPAAHSESARER